MALMLMGQFCTSTSFYLDGIFDNKSELIEIVDFEEGESGETGNKQEEDDKIPSDYVLNRLDFVVPTLSIYRSTVLLTKYNSEVISPPPEPSFLSE